MSGVSPEFGLKGRRISAQGRGEAAALGTGIKICRRPEWAREFFKMNYFLLLNKHRIEIEKRY